MPSDAGSGLGDADRPRLSVRSCLVLGGARSGKSAYALELAQRAGSELVYLATAAVWDDEMRRRVDRHKTERDARWRTVEEQIDLGGTLRREAATDRVVLVDCLTLWLSNVMLAGRDAEAETAGLVSTLASLPGRVVLVSNEVGAGIVPDNALARAFRDAQGRLNQAVAGVCDAAVLVSAGLPVLLKPRVTPGLDLGPPSR